MFKKLIYLLALIIVCKWVFSFFAESVHNVQVVEVSGAIDGSMDVVREINEAASNEAIKAIVIRVDSPGGAVGASQEIYDEILKAKVKKPVVVSMGNVAASGGYYIACAADYVVANPGTVTGSIGVISQFVVLDDFLKKFQIKWETIRSGNHKDIGSPFRSLTPDEKQLLQEMTMDIYSQFVEAVSKGRKLTIDQVKAIADGRIMSGSQALKAHLVDELGGLEKAIEIAAKRANISGEPTVQYPSDEPVGVLKKLLWGEAFSHYKVEYRL